MEQFLQQLKKCTPAFKAFQKVHVIMGNEACDLDSAVSALSYAYYLNKKKTENEIKHIPVLNIPEKDYSLRTEVNYSLNKRKIDKNSLIFRDQLNLDNLYENQKLILTLVDHNVLRKQESKYETSVIEIIDHHKQEREHVEGISISLEMVGSCCTLVAEKMLNDTDFLMDQDVAHLLYETILLDTVCLSPTAGRTTAKDITIIEKLESLLPGVARQEVFDSIQKAKFDCSTLSAMDLLRKDLKMVESSTAKIAMSSVPLHMKEFLLKENIAKEFQTFVDDHEAGAVIVMSMCMAEDGLTPSRQLAIYSKDSALQKQIIEVLKCATEPCLKLTEIDTETDNTFPIVAFNQEDTQASEEIVLQLIKDFIDVEAGSELINSSETNSQTNIEHSLIDVSNEFTYLEDSDNKNPIENISGLVDLLGIGGDIDIATAGSPSEENLASVPNTEDPFGLFDPFGVSALGIQTNPTNLHTDLSPSVDLLGLDPFGSVPSDSNLNIPLASGDLFWNKDPFGIEKNNDSHQNVLDTTTGIDVQNSALGDSWLVFDTKAEDDTVVQQNTETSGDSLACRFVADLSHSDSKPEETKFGNLLGDFGVVESNEPPLSEPKVDELKEQSSSTEFTPENTENELFNDLVLEKSHNSPEKENKEKVVAEEILKSIYSTEGNTESTLLEDFEVEDLSKHDQNLNSQEEDISDCLEDFGVGRTEDSSPTTSDQVEVSSEELKKTKESDLLGSFELDHSYLNQPQIDVQLKEEEGESVDKTQISPLPAIVVTDTDVELISSVESPSYEINSSFSEISQSELDTNGYNDSGQISVSESDSNEILEAGYQVILESAESQNEGQEDLDEKLASDNEDVSDAKERVGLDDNSLHDNSLHFEAESREVKDSSKIAFVAGLENQKKLLGFEIDEGETVGDRHTDRSFESDDFILIDHADTESADTFRFIGNSGEEELEGSVLPPDTENMSDVRTGNDPSLGPGDILLEGGNSFGNTPEQMTPDVSATVTPDQQKSCPATPPNSFMDSNMEANRHHLPSFNSSEMVQKLEAKQTTMEAMTGRKCSPRPGHLFPFTPQNSFCDENFTEFARQHNLPSFNNSEMVEKIREKRSEMAEDSDSGDLIQAGQDVFTPPNSLIDSPVDGQRKQKLPMFSSEADLLKRVHQKSLKSKLAEGYSEEESEDGEFGPPMTSTYREEGFEPVDENERELAFQLVAQNVVASQIAQAMQTLGYISTGVQNQHSVSCVSEGKLSEILEEGEVEDAFSPENSYTQETFRREGSVGSDADDEDEELPMETRGNVVAYQIACDMGIEGSNNNKKLPGFEGTSDRNGENTDHLLAQKITQDVVENAKNIVFSTQTNGDDEVSSDFAQSSDENGEIVAKESLRLESEVAYQLAQDIIHKAMETIEAQSLKSNMNEVLDLGFTPGECCTESDRHSVKDISQSSQAPMVSLDFEIGESSTDPTSVAPTSVPPTSVPSSGNTATQVVETEYLKQLDLLGGRLDIVSGNFVTAAERDVAESESFDKQVAFERQESGVEDDVKSNTGKIKRGVSFAEDEPSGAEGGCMESSVASLLATRTPSNPETSSGDTSPESPNMGMDATVSAFKVHQKTQGQNHTDDVNEEAILETANKIVDKAVTDALDIHKKELLKDPVDTGGKDEWDDEEIKTLVDDVKHELHVDMETEEDIIIEKQLERTLNGGGRQQDNREVEETNIVNRPNNLNTESTPKKKIKANLDLLKDEDFEENPELETPSSSEGDIVLSVEGCQTPTDLNTPEAMNDAGFEGELGWESETPTSTVDPIPEYTAKEEMEESRHWRGVTVGDQEFRIDMKVIEPYKKVLSHGGYYGEGFNAIVVFAGCYLPDKNRKDYQYVMDNLFLYVISTLELLVVEDYMIVYFHGATPKNKMPGLRWLKRCYDMIDRRLRKNLKSLLIVHPTLWLRTVILMTKPFVSAKFSSKLCYVRSLRELQEIIPTEYVYIPEEIKHADKFVKAEPQPTPLPGKKKKSWRKK